MQALGAVEKQKGSKYGWKNDRGKTIWEMRLEMYGERQFIGFWQFYWVKGKPREVFEHKINFV